MISRFFVVRSVGGNTPERLREHIINARFESIDVVGNASNNRKLRPPPVVNALVALLSGGPIQAMISATMPSMLLFFERLRVVRRILLQAHVAGHPAQHRIVPVCNLAGANQLVEFLGRRIHAGLLDAAKPIAEDGTYREDAESIEARENFIVRTLLANGPVSYVILGGSHDLAKNVERLSGGKAEYLQVELKAWREFAEP